MKDRGRDGKSWFTRVKESFIREFRKNYLEEKPAQIVKNILLVVLGSVLLAASSAFFIIPADLVSGGVSGLGIVIQWIVELCGGDVAYIGGVNTVVTILTVFFFILGIFIVGWDFTMKTAISTVVYPAFLWIFQAIRNIESLDWIRVETYMTDSTWGNYGTLAVIGVFGGILMGLGVALAFRGGGSTGGTDCLVIAISKHTKLKANTVSVLSDTIIIVVGIFISQDLMSGLIGIMAAIICSVMISRFFVGSQNSYTATIVSERWKEISDAINSEMVRGTTIYPAKGGYTGDQKQVVSVTFTDREYSDLAKIIHRFDPEAFITINQTHEVRGLGFSREDDAENPPRRSEDNKTEGEASQTEVTTSEEMTSTEENIETTPANNTESVETDNPDSKYE